MIMNRSARLIRWISARDRITPVLIDLHWLPIKARIVYKICVLTHQALCSGAPVYLRSMLEVLQPTNAINTRRAYNGFLNEPRCSSFYGFRAFKSAAPRLYNGLPSDIKSIDNIRDFKGKLKTYLFRKCYDLDDLTMSPEYAL